MKKLIVILIAVFSVYLFAVNENARTEAVKEIEKIQEEVSNTGGGNSETTSSTPTVNNYTNEEISYFNEIALSSEYSDQDKGLACTWKNDVKIFVQGTKKPELMSELQSIVGELNDLIDPIDIKIVNSKDESNYTIFFGSQYDYHNITPGSTNLTEHNWGLFVVNSGQTIRRGSMYVDIYRCTELDGQKHLLREELTQSLGLFNDSYKYDNSIFQQRWTTTTEYADIDKKIIQILYNN
jgi:hypothetical protein